MNTIEIFLLCDNNNSTIMKSPILINLAISLLLLNILLSSSTLGSRTSIIIPQSLPIDNFTTEKSHIESAKSLIDQPYQYDQLSNFTLSVKLHDEEAIVEGNLTVDYYNDDPISFDRIPFHLYPSGMEYNEIPGEISIDETKTEGSPNILDIQVISSEQLMWINLIEPLNPAERISFTIYFNTTLPDGGIDRTNYHGTDIGQSKIFKFAVAYPMPAVYDEKDGWNIDPYLNVGDPFYSDMAWYDFFVEVPTEFIVAATGKLINTTINSDTIRYQYDPILPVRELVFSASKYFICESIIINNVNISTFYLPKSQLYWENFALDVAVQAVTLYNDTFGTYPYPTFNVVEDFTHYGGMEHPLQVYITEAIYGIPGREPQDILELIIAHETCHQWFYHLVGNDEIDAGFLDEGLVVWATDYYIDDRYPERNLYEDYYLQYNIRHYNNTVGRPNKINQSIYECSTSYTDYWYIAYQKAPMILQKLRVFLGDEDYLSSIKLFFDRFKYKIAWLSDLQNAFEDVYGKSLDFFFNPWFNNIYLPKYSFSSMFYDKESSLLNITIKDLNENCNEYQYSQEMTFEIYDDEANSIFSNEIWINGTTSISLNLSTSLPDRIRLIFTDYVLAQSIEGREYVEFELPKENINGMPYIAFFISFSFGISLVIKQMRKKKNY